MCSVYHQIPKRVAVWRVSRNDAATVWTIEGGSGNENPTSRSNGEILKPVSSWTWWYPIKRSGNQ